MTIPIKIISKKEFEKNNDKPKQESVWDNIAKPWKTYVVKKIPIVEEFLRGKKGLVVDLGCGTGRNMIKEKGLKYFGVDFSKGQLVHARKFVENEGLDAELICSRVDKLDKKLFKDEMFDYGLFIATLYCLENEKDRNNALMEFYRILKKGAEGLISVWDSSDNRFNCVGNKGDIYMSWRERGVSYFRYYYLYSKEELLKLLKNVGFEIVEVYSRGKSGIMVCGIKDLNGVVDRDRFSKKNLIVRIKKI